MGMVAHHRIMFSPQALPSIDAVVQTTSVLAGLPVYYSDYILELICPALGLRVGLYEGSGAYQITTFSPNTDYLQVTTIKALQQLGGHFDGMLPAWAGQSWKQLNKWTYRFQRQRITYPPDAPW